MVGSMAYLIQYFQGGSLIGSSTAVGALNQVSQSAERGMRSRRADAVKVCAGGSGNAVWSMERPTR